LRSLLHKSAAAGFGFLVTAASVFLLNVVLSRELGSRDYGVISLILTWALIGAHFAQLGFNRASSKVVSIALDRGELSELRAFYRFAHTAAICCGILIGGLFYLTFDLVNQLDTLTYKAGLLCGALVVPFALSRVASGILIGAGHNSLGAFFQNGLPNLLMLVCISSYFFWAATVEVSAVIVLMAAAAAVAGLVAILLSGLALRASWGAKNLKVRWKAWLSLSLPIMTISSIQILGRQTGILILGAFGTAEMVGEYVPAIRIGEIASFSLLAVNAAMVARFSVLYSKGEIEQLQHVLSKTFALISSVGLCALIFIGLFADEIIGLFGLSNSTIKVALLVLLASQLIDILSGSTAALMTVANQERYAAIVAVLTTACTVIGSLLLIPVYGIVGAACASLISMIVWNVLLIRRCRRHVRVDASVFQFLFPVRPQEANVP